MKRKLSAIVAFVMTVMAIQPTTFANSKAVADDTYNINVSINLDGERKEISPYIYGVNEYAFENLLDTSNYGSIRQGGNRLTGYNWENNFSNAGADYHHQNDTHLNSIYDPNYWDTNIGDYVDVVPDGLDPDAPAYIAQRLSVEAKEHNIPYTLATVQMAGYVAADAEGEVTEEEAAPSTRWVKVEPKKDGELSLEPDLDDGVVYMDEYVNYLVNKLGDSTTPTGIKGYSLDNEPEIWSHTHPRIHPVAFSMKELHEKSIETAKAVKSVDPNADVFGSVLCNFYFMIGGDSDPIDPSWSSIKEQNGYNWYVDYFLDDMKKAEGEYGQRLVDVYDFHWYPPCDTDSSTRNVARNLYDPSYYNSAWLYNWYTNLLPLLPKVQDSIDKYYPGTKMAITEYDCGRKNNINSAIAQTEILGAFAANGVYLATRWTQGEGASDFILNAFNLYRNYDGNNSMFGDTYVETTNSDLDKSFSFASIDGDDESVVKVVLGNREEESTEKATITIDGSENSYHSAKVYAITQDSSDIQLIDVQNFDSTNEITVELPPLSIAQVVISEESSDYKTAFEITSEMGAGWNLGNNFDCYVTDEDGNYVEFADLEAEGIWGKRKATKELIEAIKAKGFNTIRIPCTWFQHFNENGEIDSKWLARVHEIVDYAYDLDMYVIINMHHEKNIINAPVFNDVSLEKALEEMTAVWTTLANEFSNYGQRLIFEGMNEPRQTNNPLVSEWGDGSGDNGYTWDYVNKLNQNFINIVRNQGSQYNKERLLIITPYCATSNRNAIMKLDIPENSGNIAISSHAYAPFDFALRSDNLAKSEFTDSMKIELDNLFNSYKSIMEQKNVPIIIGEYGASNRGNTADRIKWITYYNELAKEAGIPTIIWDNDSLINPAQTGEAHGYIDRETIVWHEVQEPVIDALIQVWKAEIKGDVNGDGRFTIADMVMLQKWLLGSGELTVWKNGDLCEDGIINVFDLCMIQRLLIQSYYQKPNMIKSANYWDQVDQSAGAVATIARSSDSLSVNVTSGGANTWSVQSIFNDITLTEGETYMVSFDYSTSENVELMCCVMNMEDYTSYLANVIDSTSEKQHFRQTFKMNTTDTQGRLSFDFGGQNVPFTATITNIKLVKIS